MGVEVIHNVSTSLVIYDGIEIQPASNLVVPVSSKLQIAADSDFIRDIFSSLRPIWVEDSIFAGRQFYDQQGVDILLGKYGILDIAPMETISAINPTINKIESVYSDSDIMTGYL